MSELEEYMEYMKIQQEILGYLKKEVKTFGSFKSVPLKMSETHRNDRLKATIQKIERTTLKDIEILRNIHKDIFEDKIFEIGGKQDDDW